MFPLYIPQSSFFTETNYQSFNIHHEHEKPTCLNDMILSDTTKFVTITGLYYDQL